MDMEHDSINIARDSERITKYRSQIMGQFFKIGDWVDFWNLGVWHMRWQVLNVRVYPPGYYDRPVYELVKNGHKRLIFKDYEYMRMCQCPQND